MLDIVFRYDPQDWRNFVQPADGDAARQRLEEGNQVFAHLLDGYDDDTVRAAKVIPFDLAGIGFGDKPGEAPPHTPFAVVLGCSDARAPTELIFNQGGNDLFVVRVAGNVLGAECLGSIDYAVQNLPTVKLVVVLAHSGCGAVTAAVDTFLEPSRYLQVANTYTLRAIIDRLLVVVRGSVRSLEEVFGSAVTQEPGYRQALIEIAVVLNAALTAHTLEEEYGPQTKSGLQVVYGVYDLVSRHVRLPLVESALSDDCDVHLVAPPASQKDFIDLAEQLAASPHIRHLLKNGG